METTIGFLGFRVGLGFRIRVWGLGFGLRIRV